MLILYFVSLNTLYKLARNCALGELLSRKLVLIKHQFASDCPENRIQKPSRMPINRKSTISMDYLDVVQPVALINKKQM